MQYKSTRKMLHSVEHSDSIMSKILSKLNLKGQAKIGLKIPWYFHSVSSTIRHELKNCDAIDVYEFDIYTAHNTYCQHFIRVLLYTVHVIFHSN
jgi:hypothetical protein